MKNKYLNIVIILIVLTAALSILSYPIKYKAPIKSPEVSQIPANIKSVQIAGQNVKVDLALSTATQEEGLSGRASLVENTGMLFVFLNPGKYAFWMKDMKFAIDMVWISEDLKVVYIQKNATPASYPATFGPGISDRYAEYVLEVPSGFVDKNGLKLGDSLLFTY